MKVMTVKEIPPRTTWKSSPLQYIATKLRKQPKSILQATCTTKNNAQVLEASIRKLGFKVTRRAILHGQRRGQFNLYIQTGA